MPGDTWEVDGCFEMQVSATGRASYHSTSMRWPQIWNLDALFES